MIAVLIELDAWHQPDVVRRCPGALRDVLVVAFARPSGLFVLGEQNDVDAPGPRQIASLVEGQLPVVRPRRVRVRNDPGAFLFDGHEWDGTCQSPSPTANSEDGYLEAGYCELGIGRICSLGKEPLWPSTADISGGSSKCCRPHALATSTPTVLPTILTS